MGVPLTQAVGLGFVVSPPWGSPAHTSRLSLSSFRSAAGEAEARPGEAQNPEGSTQKIGNIVPVLVSHVADWVAFINVNLRAATAQAPQQRVFANRHVLC